MIYCLKIPVMVVAVTGIFILYVFHRSLLCFHIVTNSHEQSRLNIWKNGIQILHVAIKCLNLHI